MHFKITRFVTVETELTTETLDEMYMKRWKPKGVKDFVQTTFLHASIVKQLNKSRGYGPGTYKIQVSWSLKDKPFHVRTKLWKMR